MVVKNSIFPESTATNIVTDDLFTEDYNPLIK